MKSIAELDRTESIWFVYYETILNKENHEDQEKQQ